MIKHPDRKDLNGIIIINKPGGMTSHDVVNCVRRRLRMRRVGHAGTLDPMATGVLVVLVGRGTKLFDKFVHFDKAYRATMVLGQRTTSADTEGRVIDQRPYDHITVQMIETAFREFTGEYEQVPPMVSAVKVNGRRLYELARQGKEVERSSRTVRIDQAKLLNFNLPHVEFLLECSKGTYVRQFAEDVGEWLNCGACICQIERTEVGPYHIKDAVDLEDVQESDVRDFCPAEENNSGEER